MCKGMPGAEKDINAIKTKFLDFFFLLGNLTPEIYLRFYLCQKTTVYRKLEKKMKLTGKFVQASA